MWNSSYGCPLQVTIKPNCMKNSIHSYKSIIVLTLCIFLLQNFIHSQTLHHQDRSLNRLAGKCLSDAMIEHQCDSDPSMRARINSMNEKMSRVELSGTRSVVTIPVVVHVVFDAQPLQIGAAEIDNAINHLNAAFSNTGLFYDPDGVDTQIQFCRAIQDPSGNSSTGWTIAQSSFSNLTAETEDESLKLIDMWDPTQYINIWIVQSITSLSMGDGIAGYAFFPALHGSPIDGIVVEAQYFGNSIDNDKVLVHEVGHYLGLYHTFEGGCVNGNCQTDGDHVCDTPPDNSTAPVACSELPNTCSSDANDTSSNNPFRPVALGGLGDQPDMYNNYMDYGYQACQTAFTQGQSDRMNSALNGIRKSLLSSDGCIEPCPSWISEIQILNGQPSIEIGSSLSFTSNAIDTAIHSWKLNGEIESNIPFFNYTFTEIGHYLIELETTYPNSTCHRFAQYTVNVVCDATASFISSSASSFGINSTVEFENTSSDALSYIWVLDGSIYNNQEDWSQYFSSAGSHRIMLVASSEICADTSNTYFFEIGDCNFSGINANWVLDEKLFHMNENGNNTISNLPVNIDIYGLECASTISDVDGNLLFYTNGEKVWDRNHQQMPNGFGLLAQASSTQATLIVPHPGSPDKYFIFTNDAVETYFSIGIHYSIVDLSLNGGMGDVLPDYKNVWLADGMSEKLTATWHTNGSDIWLLVSNIQGNIYHAYLIDGNGIHPEPTSSAIGDDTYVGLGSMAISHDGNRMATFVISDWPWKIMLADFNKATGEFSNPIQLDLSSEANEQIFGIEFSPDNSKLYCSMVIGSGLLQYDLTYSTASEINASKYFLIDDYAWVGHINIGRDDKVYVYNRFYNTLDVIENPNEPGAACNFDSPNNDIVIDAFYSQYLSNIVEGFNAPHQSNILGPSQICVGANQYQYGVQSLHAGDVCSWSHSGNASVQISIDNESLLLTSSNQIGTDTLYLEITGGCGITYDTLVVHTNVPMPYTPIEDRIYCGDTILFTIENNYYYHQWSDGSHDNTFEVTSPGNYWLVAHDLSGCVIQDAFVLLDEPNYSNLNLGPDQNICQGGVFVLSTNVVYPNYSWQDQSTQSTFTVYSPGTYWLTVSDECGVIDSDTIQFVLTIPELNLTYNNLDHICSDQLPIMLIAPPGFNSFLWNNSVGGNSIQLTTVGTTSLTAMNSNGCYASDTFIVEVCDDVRNNDSTQPGIFPNPASEQLTIRWNNSHGIFNGLFDSRGRLVSCPMTISQNEILLNVKSLSTGLYFIRYSQIGEEKVVGVVVE